MYNQANESITEMIDTPQVELNHLVQLISTKYSLDAFKLEKALNDAIPLTIDTVKTTLAREFGDYISIRLDPAIAQRVADQFLRLEDLDPKAKQSKEDDPDEFDPMADDDKDDRYSVIIF
jgi:hypothetical protein